jgi:hypothetical protein
MLKKNSILIFGSGGHCRPVLDIVKQNYKLKIDIYDIDAGIKSKSYLILGHPVNNNFRDLNIKNLKKNIGFLAIGNNQIRKKFYNNLSINLNLENLISKRSFLS